jgi:hypothetical protein
VPPAYYLHPEFGLLCPSTSFRRKARLALAALAALVIVGTLALTAGRDPDIDGPLMITRSEEVRSDAGISQAASLAVTAERSRLLEGRETVCEGDPWSQIDGKCNIGKTHKRRSPGAANKDVIISRFPLGRSSSPVTASSVAPINPAGTNPSTDVPTLAMSDPSGPRGAAPMKVHKSSWGRNSARNLSPDSNWRDEPWSARAYALPSNRKPSGRYAWSWGWSWCPAPSHCDKTTTLK